MTTDPFYKSLYSLSERLKDNSGENNAYENYIDQKIKSENLQFNLSYTLSHIVTNLDFIERSKAVFEQILDDYNIGNHTTLSFESFTEINWVREIFNEVVIPELVRHFILEVGYYEGKGKPIDIPHGKNDHIRCLQIYYKRCFENAKLSISKSKLTEILANFASQEVTAAFLIERKIIKQGFEADYYCWCDHDYVRHLRKEIASTLWLLVGNEDADVSQFAKYFKLIRGIGIYVGNLEEYLNYKNTAKISELALAYLTAEDDLLWSKNEFCKGWLDVRGHGDVDLNTEIPIIDLNYNNPYEFIEFVESQRGRFSEIFFHQKTRAYCYTLIRLIIQNIPDERNPCKTILSLIEDSTRPYLLSTLYYETRRSSYLIPYFLTNHELSPLAFKAIEEIEVKGQILKEQSNITLQFEEKCEIINNFWIEMFDVTLNRISSTRPIDVEGGELLAKILLDIAEKVFTDPSNHVNNMIRHNSWRKRYDMVLKQVANKRIKENNIYSRPPIHPRLIFPLLPFAMRFLNNRLVSHRPSRTEYLRLEAGIVDLSIELLRFKNLRISEFEISEEQQELLNEAYFETVNQLQAYLSKFYTQIEAIVEIYANPGQEKRKVKRGTSQFGFEIIDWGLLYLHFETQNILESLYENFAGGLAFNTDSNKYDDQNKDQFAKIQLFLKSSMMAFISINQSADSLAVNGLPVKSTSARLEKWIRKLSLLYSVNDLKQKRIDVFDERFSVFGHDIYYQHLSQLLYKCINNFKEGKQREFVERFFENNFDIGRMLTAVNIFDSGELKDIISERLSMIQIEDFIGNSITTTELQYALVEAANSENHWKLSKPLIEKIENHFAKVKYTDDNINYFLFEIRLLLALKEKDYTKLINLPIPKSKYNRDEDKKAINTKLFFMALYKIYNDKDYDDAISKLELLLSEETKNIRFAFRLFRAETLKAVETTDLALLKQAHQDWDSFVNGLNGDEKKTLSEFGEAIGSNSIHYYVATNDSVRVDQMVNTLSKVYLYDEEIVPIIYGYYTQRSLHELAFSYLQNAKEYYIENGTKVTEKLQSLFNNSSPSHLLESLKRSLINIRSLKAKDIPLIIPDIINDKSNLDEFILNEIVQGSKVLIDKIHGIKKIPHEDRYNDLLLAILRLRFQVWAWSVHDQARKGSSPTGKNAGETDITIEAGNITIALFEALILTGKDKTLTEKHVLKSFSYAKNLDRYYMLVYFKGSTSAFESTWKSYKEDIKNTIYTTALTFDKHLGFEELTSNFDDVRHLKIAKSKHGKNINMYHLMLDLSEK